MRALIVEDEIYNFKILKTMILHIFPKAEIDGPVTNLIDLERTMLDQQRYDVIYCDIRLEDGLCFSVFEDIDVTTPIIFTTAYSEYALKAFGANGIAYLLKPVEKEALRKATDKALSMNHERQDIGAMLESIGMKGCTSYLHYLKANTYNGAYIVDVANVSHFVTDGRKSFAMMNDGTKHAINYTIEQLMQRLDPVQFFRANRQYIVARRAIYRIQSYGSRQMLIKLNVYSDVPIIVSKERVSALNDWIEQ